MYSDEKDFKQSHIKIEGNRAVRVKVLTRNSVYEENSNSFIISCEAYTWSNTKIQIIDECYRKDTIELNQAIDPYSLWNLLNGYGFIVDAVANNLFNCKQSYWIPVKEDAPCLKKREELKEQEEARQRRIDEEQRQKELKLKIEERKLKEQEEARQRRIDEEQRQKELKLKIEERKLKEQEEARQRRIDEEQRQKEKLREAKRACHSQPRCVNLTMKGEIYLGMPEAALLVSWGEPESINRTVSSNRTHKQYVYGSRLYVYVENGIISAWQD